METTSLDASPSGCSGQPTSNGVARPAPVQSTGIHGTLGAAFHAAAPSARAPVAQEFRRPLRWYPVRVLT